MDSVFAVQYNGGVILAADQSNGRSIITYQKNIDKIAHLTSHSAMAISGQNCDLVNFSEYISKNIKLYELANDGTKLSTDAQANFCRNELAYALRRGPYQVNLLLGGYDSKTDSASLYFIDYFAAMQKVKYGAHGYAQMFTLGIMDKEYKENLTEAEAVQIVEHCIQEVQIRFMISQPNFIIKAVDKDGVRVVKFGADPADT